MAKKKAKRKTTKVKKSTPHRIPKPPRVKEELATIADAIANAFSIMEELREECQTWFDNLNEGLQNTNTGERLQEAVNVIENVQTVDMTSVAALLSSEIQCSYFIATKRQQSRADRRDDAVGMLRAAAGIVQEKIDELETMPEDISAEEAASRQGESSALSDFQSEIDAAADEFDSVEFPGMYGR